MHLKIHEAATTAAAAAAAAKRAWGSPRRGLLLPFPLSSQACSDVVAKVARDRRSVVPARVALLDVGPIALPRSQLAELLNGRADVATRCQTSLGMVPSLEVARAPTVHPVDAPRDEDMPPAPGLLPVDLADGVLLAFPDQLPLVQGAHVAHAQVVRGLHLEARTLEVRSDPAERGR